MRTARNEYFAALLSKTPDGARSSDIDLGKADFSPWNDGRWLVWVVGTFESSHVYSADNNGGSLYTEINIRVENVITKPSTCSVTVGSTIDTYLPGGVLKTKDGVVHSSKLSPERFSFEPGHRYILALNSKPARLFAEAKRWDVTDGRVKVSSESDEAHVAAGKSMFVGLSMAGAIRTIKETMLQCAPNVPSCIDWTNAGNRWRQIPVDQVSQNDPVPADVRAARTEDLLPILKMGLPWGGGVVDYIYEAPEVVTAGRDNRNAIWIVGTFESYRVVSADSSNELLYTEMTLRIKTVIYDPNTPAVTAGSTVDTFRLFGSLRTLDGVEHGAHFYPEKYDVYPGHTYIMALHSRPGGFFQLGDEWDVTNGVVEQSSAMDEIRAQDGKSKIVGMPLETAIQFVKDAHSPRGSIMRGDKGCPDASLFAQSSSIARDDFIELHTIFCAGDCPLYTVRVYGDGRLVWHGESVVKAVGDTSAMVDATQAQALIAKALKLGFGGLCDEYVEEYPRRGNVWEASMKVGGQTKRVYVTEDSDEPLWLDQLFEPVVSLPVVEDLISAKPKVEGRAPMTPWR